MNRRSLAALMAGTLLAAAPLALAAPKEKALSFRRVVLANQNAYGEPSLALSDDGKHIAVCVPGGAGQTSVWYSNSDGKWFGTSHTTSDNGGGDCELDYLPNGTLLNVDLEVTDSAVRWSKDFGKTWHGTATAGIEQDRQWLAHSKDGKTAYLVYHDFVAEAELYAQSNDGGMTWPANLAAQPVTNVDQIALPGIGPGAPGQPASLIDQGVNTFSGPMLVSPDGKDLYVIYSISDAKRNIVDGTPPFGRSAGIVVAHKGPEDLGFTNTYAVPNDTVSESGAIFSWGAVDKAGTIYVLYNSDKGSPGHFHTFYAYSKNKAKSWSKPIKVDNVPAGRGAQIYATGDAGAPGVLDIAWYGHSGSGGSDDPLASWDIHFAQVRHATSAHPSITRTKVAPGDPMHAGQICLNGLLCITGGDRSLLDFFELQIGRDGMAQIAYADNTGEFEDGKKGHVIWAKQVGGRSAYSP